MQFEKLALWYSAVSKYSSVFMKYLSYTYNINAQEHSSRHDVKSPTLRAATKYSAFLWLIKGHLKNILWADIY